MRYLTYTATPEDEGLTIEQLLRRRLKVSHTAVRRAKRMEGGITLDGVRSIAPTPVKAGQVVGITLEDKPKAPERAFLKPEPGELNILYEDPDLLVVDKPAGLVMYPGLGHDGDTLANYVKHYYVSAGRSSKVHSAYRLDAGTTGVVVFTTSSIAANTLQWKLHTPQFVREYLAVCEGVPEPAAGVVEAPIERISRGPSVWAVSESGKPARTHYEVLGSFELADGTTASLVKARLETGRTHQIRIHMAHIGHPLVGDDAYGTPSPAIARPALHSARLAFDHPITGTRLELESPLPADMAHLLS